MDTFAQNVYQHRVVYIVKKSADIALYEPLYTCKSTLYLLQSFLMNVSIVQRYLSSADNEAIFEINSDNIECRQ